MDHDKVFRMAFARLYPLYVQKVERKGRTRGELHVVLQWLTGYDEGGLQQQIDSQTDLATFFAQAPCLNPDVSKITGTICGHRVEAISDPLMQKIRYMDKLVDELAKGRAMEKILRK